MPNFHFSTMCTICGAIKEHALWVTPEKEFQSYNCGEILKKESAAVNTIVTMLWGFPQRVVTTHISVPDINIFLHSLCSRATDVDTQKPNAKHNYAFKQWKTIELFIIFQNFCQNKLRTTFQV